MNDETATDNISPIEYLKRNAYAILLKDSRTQTILHQVGDNIIRIQLSIKPLSYYENLEKYDQHIG